MLVAGLGLLNAGQYKFASFEMGKEVNTKNKLIILCGCLH